MCESANRKSIKYNWRGFIVLRPLGDRVIIEVAKRRRKNCGRYRALLQQPKKNLKQEPSLQSVKDAR